MSEPIVVGLAPCLPEPLSQMPWWTKPVRAERLAAFRIAVGAMLLLDVLLFYLPRATDFFGPGSLGSAEVFAGRLGNSTWHWSLLHGLADGPWMHCVLLLWAAAAFCLMIGFLPRLSAVVAWVIAMSVHNLNFYIHNSGDNVKLIALFYLMLCPAGAAWSVQSVFQGEGVGSLFRWRYFNLYRRFAKKTPDPIYVHPWPLRLLMVQLTAIYFVNGVYKLAGGDWRSGEVMHYVLHNVAWTRFAYADLPLPPLAIPAMTYTTLIWELGFPLLILIPRLRTPTLVLGVAFHLGTAALLQLGMFPLYMLCLYVPLVPWEQFSITRSVSEEIRESPSSPLLANASG